MGVERTPNKSAHKIKSGEENSPAAPAKIQICNLLIMSLALYQQTVTIVVQSNNNEIITNLNNN